MCAYCQHEHVRPVKQLAWTPDGSVLFGLAVGKDDGDGEREGRNETHCKSCLWAVSCGCAGLLFHTRDPVLVGQLANRGGSDWSHLMFTQRDLPPR